MACRTGSFFDSLADVVFPEFRDIDHTVRRLLLLSLHKAKNHLYTNLTVCVAITSQGKCKDLLNPQEGVQVRVSGSSPN